jgi:hypothetical protein
VGLLQRVFDWIQPLPSFEDLRRGNLERASTFSRERIIAELERYPFARTETRDEVLRLARARPFDAAAYAQCRTLTALPYCPRPGEIEEVWYLEGLIERLRALDEAERR